MKFSVKQCIGFAIAFLTLFGMVWAGNEYVAKQDDVRELEACAAKLEKETAKQKDLKVLEDKVISWRLEDQAYAIQKRLWFLQQTYGCPNCPQPMIDEYRRLQQELARIMRKLRGYYKPETPDGGPG